MDKLNLIYAVDCNDGFAKNQNIPWHLPNELKHFYKITRTVTDPNKMKNAVVMGRKTWESLPVRPLPHRLNVIITSQKDILKDNMIDNVKVYDNLLLCLSELNNNPYIEKIFVIGGVSILENTMCLAKRIYLTKIDKDYECDVVAGFNLDYNRFQLVSVNIEKEIENKQEVYYKKIILDKKR